MNNYYKPGAWNVICSLCGRKVKSTEILKRWDGLLVCKEDYDPRNILDFYRPVNDSVPVPFTNPEQPDNFTPETCTLQGRQGMAGFGVSGCSIASLVIPYVDNTELNLFDREIAITGLAVAGLAIAGRPYSLSPNE